MLVGHPYSDGVTIKILVGGNLKTQAKFKIKQKAKLHATRVVVQIIKTTSLSE